MAARNRQESCSERIDVPHLDDDVESRLRLMLARRHITGPAAAAIIAASHTEACQASATDRPEIERVFAIARRRAAADPGPGADSAPPTAGEGLAEIQEPAPSAQTPASLLDQFVPDDLPDAGRRSPGAQPPPLPAIRPRRHPARARKGRPSLLAAVLSIAAACSLLAGLLIGAADVPLRSPTTPAPDARNDPTPVRPPVDLELLALDAPTPSGEVPLAIAATAPPLGSERPPAAATEPLAAPAAAIAPDPRAAAGSPLRVVIHLRAGAPNLAQAATARLSAAGIATAAVRIVPFQVTRPSVRYFFPEDERAARQVLEALQADDGGRWSPGRLRDFTHYEPKPRRGTIEIWLADA